MSNEREIVDFTYSSDEKYVNLMLTSLISVMEHSDKNRTYVCHYFQNNIRPKSLAKINLITRKYKNLVLKIYDRKILGIPDLNEHGRYSQSSFDRLKMGDFFQDKKKLLYIDSDSYVVGDIAKVYDIDITGYAAGVFEEFTLPDYVRDKMPLKKDNIKNNKYENLTWDIYAVDILKLKNPLKWFCSAFLLMNLEEWRKKNIGNESIDFIQKIEPIFPDQDALNKIIEDDVFFLHPYMCIPYSAIMAGKRDYREHKNECIFYSVKPGTAKKYGWTEYLDTLNYVSKYKLPPHIRLLTKWQSFCNRFKKRA